MKFDVISDLHVDHWNPFYIEKGITYIMPLDPSDILVLAGDYSSDNELTYRFIKLLKQYYKHIIMVLGNHDYYLVNKKLHTSTQQIEILRQRLNAITNVHVLNGTTITIDNTTFGGCDMWYDYQFGIQKLAQTQAQMTELWHNYMSDGKYLTGIMPLELFELEFKKLYSIIDQSDVLVTHVGPDWSRVSKEFSLDPSSGFFYFDGDELLKSCRGKTWIYGHTHSRDDYIKYGCRLVNAAFGYLGRETSMRSIITIDI